jgi:Spy/CpxP family protein refolding chaperone
MHAHFWHPRHRHRLNLGWGELAWAGCGPSPRASFRDDGFGGRRYEHRRAHDEDLFGGAGLGVRRPLRFLAYRLDLSAEQTQSLARILERVKLERAQAALDLRRASADLADALDADSLDRARLDGAAAQRAAATQRSQEAVARALEELHALLDPEQRGLLAELIRTGTLRL